MLNSKLKNQSFVGGHPRRRQVLNLVRGPFRLVVLFLEGVKRIIAQVPEDTGEVDGLPVIVAIKYVVQDTVGDFEA
jgi:hypothetical protein